MKNIYMIMKISSSQILKILFYFSENYIKPTSEEEKKISVKMIRRREQLLTVDCTAYNSVQSNQHRDFYLVEYNINIPAFVVYNREDRWNALERIRVLLETDFNPTDEIDYQITGTYVLRNTENNDTREWVGSFYAGLHNPAIIQDFQLFDRHSFVNTVHLSLENVDEKLLYNGRDTKWEFESLQSVIINVQTTVFKTHRVLVDRRLQGRRRKFRQTFELQ